MDELPGQAVACMLGHLPLRERSRLACVCRTWRAASGVQLEAREARQASLLHVDLTSRDAARWAAACPLMSMARSADVTMEEAFTRPLLDSMPSLERLRVSKLDAGAAGVPLGRMPRLTSLKLETVDSGIFDNEGFEQQQPVQGGEQQEVGAGAPGTAAAAHATTTTTPPSILNDVELRLVGREWPEADVADVARQLASRAGSSLRELTIECASAALYAAPDAALGELHRLEALQGLRLVPGDDARSTAAVAAAASSDAPGAGAGFTRLPAFLGTLRHLRRLELALSDADCAVGAGGGAQPGVGLHGVAFDAVAHVPELSLTLRADALCSLRSSALPPRVAALPGLTRLALDGFTFDDPGGWCTRATFDVGALAGCGALVELDLRLRTLGAEHCDTFEVVGLDRLRGLRRLRVVVAAPHARCCDWDSAGAGGLLGRSSGDGSSGGGYHSGGAPPPQQELVLTLPKALAAGAEVEIATTLRLVLRNVASLARAASPWAAAAAIDVEERVAAGGADGDEDDAEYERAPAADVLGALRDLWPTTRLWSQPMASASAAAATSGRGSSSGGTLWGSSGGEARRRFDAQVLCAEGRDSAAAERLLGVFLAVGAAPLAAAPRIALV